MKRHGFLCALPTSIPIMNPQSQFNEWSFAKSALSLAQLSITFYRKESKLKPEKVEGKPETMFLNLSTFLHFAFLPFVKDRKRLVQEKYIKL